MPPEPGVTEVAGGAVDGEGVLPPPPPPQLHALRLKAIGKLIIARFDACPVHMPKRVLIGSG